MEQCFSVAAAVCENIFLGQHLKLASLFSQFQCVSQGLQVPEMACPIHNNYYV